MSEGPFLHLLFSKTLSKLTRSTLNPTMPHSGEPRRLLGLRFLFYHCDSTEDLVNLHFQISTDSTAVRLLEHPKIRLFSVETEKVFDIL